MAVIVTLAMTLESDFVELKYPPFCCYEHFSGNKKVYSYFHQY